MNFKLFSLLVPIGAILVLNLYKGYQKHNGVEFTFPITGVDPRSLLSGHYLTFQIDFGDKVSCPQPGLNNKNFNKPLYVCLIGDGKPYPLEVEPLGGIQGQGCQYYLKGVCSYGRFQHELNRFYIPETEARKLEDLVLKKRASVILSAQKNGVIVIKDLLIDGRVWNEKK